jgi:hypothetical protein
MPPRADPRGAELDGKLAEVVAWASCLVTLRRLFGADEATFRVARELLASHLQSESPPSMRRGGELCQISYETFRTRMNQVLAVRDAAAIPGK